MLRHPRLARAGTPQPVRIIETEESFAIGWDRQFRIEGDVFATVDDSGGPTSTLPPDQLPLLNEEERLWLTVAVKRKPG